MQGGRTARSREERLNLLKKIFLVDSPPNDPETVERNFKEHTGLSFEDFNEDTETWDTDEYFRGFVGDLKYFHREKLDGSHKIWELKYIFDVSEEDLIFLLNSIFEKIKKNPDRMSDSASTGLMKHFGYEGIDVRHIKSIDDTEFGSVIYDLKPNTILK